MRRLPRNTKRPELGQAVVEYVLTIAIAITLVGILASGFRRGLFAVWTAITRDTAAACPGCPADPTLRIR